jgi:peptide/nickel transport system permease protein
VIGPLAAALRHAWREPGGRTGILLLAAIVGAAVVGPWLLADPLAQPDIIAGATLPPSAEHLFGTDQLSRDVLARVASGARLSLAVAALAVALAVSIGALVGLMAGYWGGAVDALLMRLVDGALAIPRLFILLLLTATVDRVPIGLLIAVIGLTGWLGTSRLVRAEVLKLREQDFVLGAEALGAGRRRVIFRHLLPNTIGPLLVAATLGVGDVILLEAGLSFLGLGVPLPQASWGGMLLESKEVLITAPWTSLFPGLAIALTVLAANLLGDALRAATDPRDA